MLITNDIFKQIPDGEVFKVIITSIQNVFIKDTENRLGTTLTFVCQKGFADDWTIYYGEEDTPLDYILKNGDKVMREDNIKSLSGCDDEVLAKYRY